MSQPTTTRRSTKITAKPYTPAALFRVYDKATGAVLGYVAPSRNGKDFYHVTCDEHGWWHCDCPATVRECCHIKAAQEICEIRVKAGRPGCKAPASVTEPAVMVEVEAVTPAEVVETCDPVPSVQPAKPRLTEMLSGNRFALPAPKEAPTPRKVSSDWLLGRRRSA